MPHSHRRTTAFVALTATLAMGVSLSACSAGGGASDGDQTITIQSSWIKGEPVGDVFREQVARFTEETGIKVEITDTPNADLLTAFEADTLAGEEADVLVMNLVGDTQHWVTDGLTMDVSDIIGDWAPSDIHQSAIDTWTNDDGQVQGFPYSGGAWPIWYNKALFDQAGVEIPTTYDELVEASQDLRAAGIQPFVVAGGDWPGLNFLEWISQQYTPAEDTVDLIKNEGDFCSSPEFLKGLSLLNDMLTNGVFVDGVSGYTADTMVSAYFNGDAAMAPMGGWEFAAAPPDIQENTVLGGFPVPDGGAFDKPSIFSLESGQGFWITENGQDNLDAVKQFIQFMYEPETVTAFAVDADVTPVVPRSADDPQPTNPLQAQSLELSGDSGILTLWDNLSPVGWDQMPVSQAIYAGASTPEQSCAALEESWAAAKAG